MSKFSDSPNEEEMENLLQSINKSASGRRSIWGLTEGPRLAKGDEPVDINAIKRDRDKMQIMQSKLVPILNREDRDTAREIVKSVDELLGLTVQLEESVKNSSQQSTNRSPEKKKIVEEVIPGKSKQKAVVDISDMARPEKRVQRRTEENGSEESDQISQIFANLRHEEDSQGNQSILKKASRSDTSSKKKVQFGPETNTMGRSDKKTKLRSPPPTPAESETPEKRSLKKIQFSSGKKAFNEMFLSNLHMQICAEDLEPPHLMPKKRKLDNFADVEKLAEEMGLDREELDSAGKVDLAKEKAEAARTLEEPVDLQPFQKVFQSLFKRKQSEEEEQTGRNRITKEIDKLKKIQAKQFQEVCLDKIKYLVFLR